LLLTGIIFVVDETQQVIITQFGRPIGEPIKQAGLNFKIPFVQKVNYFDKRILEWDGKPNQIPTKDKRYIWVDTTARWKIDEPLKFMESVTNEIAAQARLDDIISSVTRDVITGRNLLQAVRATDRLEQVLDKKEQTILDVKETPYAKKNIEGENLTRIILERARKDISKYGIKLIDVRIKRINYAKEVRRRVYDRMISERKRVAEKYRSEGEGKRSEIEGRMKKELKRIQSEAYKTAEGIRGEADGKTINIYAETYSKNPEFYSFLKTLQTYQDTIDEKTTIILTTDSEYYKLLKKYQK
jgi:membrane protease subunit HflC